MDMQQLLDTTLRSIISLLVLFFVTKLLGKKQVSQLSIFDYVIGISIGNFAAEITIALESQFINGILAILIYGLVAYLISIVTMKSIVLRRFFIGVPTVLIQNGKIIEAGLKKSKLDINDLLEQCRTNNYFDVSEIEYALLEANGEISILPKGENSPLTIKDMNLKVKKQGLCANVIIDTKIMKGNLKNINKDCEWLKKELKIKGYNDTSNILLATVDINEKLTIYEKKLNQNINNVLE
ncbi:MAG: DUF421 domain-containing protein [Clostridium sp.]|nr:DUF421 domain-containing protein [Clostridium sp.]MCM1443941.1 DUF421 domain-containing protein [Candidatus Amulumruptor caecigallinarius]